MKQLRFEIDDELYTKLQNDYKETCEYMETSEAADGYSFNVYLMGILRDSFLTEDDDKKIKDEFMEIIKANPGITTRQLYELYKEKHVEQ